MKPLVIAHRGASAYRPENTLPAYDLAVEQRADMIEIDLHRTRDGAIVVTHDEDLAGIGGRGEIADASLEQVRELDAGGGERVPLLEEVLDRYGERIPFNLEIKRGTRADYEGLERLVLDAVVRRGLLAGMLFSSFYDPVLARLRALAPEARIGLLVSAKFPHRAVERALSLGAEALHPEDSVVTRSLVRDAHDAGLSVYVFTVDDPGEMRRMLDLGVDGLFTNHPDRMRALVDREGG
ncbi:glycerophosphoryl diester phosphodiesterase [Myxococcaceae bacterium]|jgi:glycerophosphoryl diester phosphodiesterase|nr:glycerophosphoryl diester phosphodiesterase [Myxococcaceae bacterium]